jgi:hypothetical protein
MKYGLSVRSKTQGLMIITRRISVEGLGEKKPHSGHRHDVKNNIKICLKDTWHKSVDWIDSTQD